MLIAYILRTNYNKYLNYFFCQRCSEASIRKV